MANQESITRFLDALRTGDIDGARSTLAAEPAIADDDVVVAACVGNADRVAELLAEDPSRAVTPVGSESWSPMLYIAHTRFHKDSLERAAAIARAAKLFIDNGAEANPHFIEPEYPDSPQTALYITVGITNNPALAHVLLEAGASPNDSESIYHAAEANNVECLELLLQYGAQLGSRSEPWQNTPLYFLMGHTEGTPMGITSTAGARWLLEHGADPNVTSYEIEETPLHLAARTGRSVETAEMLLRYGADPNMKNKAGKSAHTLAIRTGNEAVAQVILNRGGIDTTTPADRFLGACARGDAAAVAALLAEHPGIVGELLPEDMALLTHVASRGRIDVVKTMLDLGFDVSARGDLGGTALHHASWWGHHEVVDLLLRHNPPLELRCTAYQGSPLDWAVHGSIFSPNRGASTYPAIVESILSAGATPHTGLASHAGPEVAEVLKRHAGREE